MSEQGYRKLYEAAARIPHAALVFTVLDRLLAALVAGSYMIIFFWSFVLEMPETVPFLFGPAAAFVFVTVLRAALNRPRPYEVFSAEPLIEKDTEGHSFPSRHVASAFAIAAASLLYDSRIFLLLAVFGAVIAFLRVAGGVHFLKDVLAGAAIGAGIGAAGVAIFFFT